MAVGRIAAGFLWINQDLFDKYKLKAPTTLASWISVCNTFRAQGIGCLREGVGQPGFDNDTLHAIADSIKPGVFTAASEGKAKWTDPTMVQAWTIFKKLSTEKILDPGSTGIKQYPDANNAFLTGKAAMVQMGTWYQQYATADALKGAVAAAGASSGTKGATIVPIPFPDVAGNGNTPNLFGDPDYALAVNSRSKVRNAATTFALWLGTDPKGQQLVANHFNDYPALTTVSTDWSSVKLVEPSVQLPALKQLGQRVASVDQPRQAKLSAAMIQTLITANQSVVGGQATPAEAAATVAAAASSQG
jgi:ABC-type glycerol-3-phosphate transport system substrate-binding protein